MTTPITSGEFVARLAGGELDLDALSPTTWAMLEMRGVSKPALEAIAGPDHRIGGKKELERLFRDIFEKPGQPEMDPRAAKAFMTALTADAERFAKAASEKGTTLFSMRQESDGPEGAAMRRASRGWFVHVHAHETEGVIDYFRQQYDLKTERGLASFEQALTTGLDAMPANKARDFVAYLSEQDEASRDELSQLGLILYRSGKGTPPVDKLAFSGHSSDDGGVEGDESGIMGLEDIEAVARLFPEGASKIKHVKVAACFAASHSGFDTLQTAFPNLESAALHVRYAPDVSQGSPADLAGWVHDTSGAKVHLRRTDGVATWTRTEGVRGLKDETLQQAWSAALALRPAYEKYFGSANTDAATTDTQLSDYYLRVVNVLRHPQCPPALKAALEELRADVKALRHPELPRKTPLPPRTGLPALDPAYSEGVRTRRGMPAGGRS